MGMRMLVLRMTREGLRALPARRRVERGTLPARLGLRVVRYGVESVGEADALTLSRFAPPVLASLELVRLIVHPLLGGQIPAAAASSSF